MASSLRLKKYDYSRPQLKAFQTAAGVEPDGHYGNDTWGALLYYTSDAPRALFKPSSPTPYAWAQLARAAAAAPAPAATPARAPAPAPALTVNIGPAQLDPEPPPAPPPPADADEVPMNLNPPLGPQPPAGFDPTKAKKMAKQVATNIDQKGRNYSNALLREFQRAAGITADGLYGGGSRGALIHFGVPRPPQPLFKPTATSAYQWGAFT